MRQTTTVSQNVPVDETSAWRTGFLVCAAAATIGALPEPRLVREEAARDAEAHRLADARAEEAADRGLPGEAPSAR